MKPIIALSSRSMKRNEKDDKDIYFIQQSYKDAIEMCGAIGLSAIPNKEHDYSFLAKMCEGLLICGGLDMNSSYYNETLHEKSEIVKEDIDEMDLKLIEAFLKEKKPILGICRGIQVINVYFNGSLYQDLPSQYNSTILHAQKAERHVGTHKVELCENSFLGKNEEKHFVNSFHHQNIKKLGDGLKIVAKSEDGLIEAIESENIYAVQWHPECMMQDSFHKQIFDFFITKCKEKQ